jgi:hypothetical protein
MPTYLWILMWAVLIGGVALLALREIRAGRRRAVEVDRLGHDRWGQDHPGRGAMAEADLRSHTQGPNGFNQTWG